MSFYCPAKIDFEYFKKIRFRNFGKEIPSNCTMFELSEKVFFLLDSIEIFLKDPFISYEVHFDGDNTVEWIHINDDKISIRFETKNNKTFMTETFFKELGVFYYGDIPGNRDEAKELMKTMKNFFAQYKGIYYSDTNYRLSRRGVNFFDYEVGFLSENEFILTLKELNYKKIEDNKLLDEIKEINVAQKYFLDFIKEKIQENRIRFLTKSF